MSLHIGQEKMLLQGQIIIAKNTLEKAHGVMEGGGGGASNPPIIKGIFTFSIEILGNLGWNFTNRLCDIVGLLLQPTCDTI